MNEVKKAPSVETYRDGWRAMSIDSRIGVKRARKFLDDGAPNLTYPISGQEPCVFEEGEKIVIDPHNMWITISSVKPRNGMWKITYVLADHRPAFMGKKMGFTSNPAKALKANFIDPDEERHDEPEGIPDIQVHPEKHRQEAGRRDRQAKLERLEWEREGHRRRLLKTTSEISRRILPARIENLTKQIAVLDTSELKKAA